MLYELFKWLEECCDFPGAGLFRYITFRSGTAIILSLLISMVFGGRIVRYLQKLQVGESVRDLGLTGQKQKEGTPTMGGVIIIMAILLPCLLMADLSNVYILVMLLATVWMGVIGFIDDYIKVFKKNKKGLSGKFKVLGQVGLGLIVALVMLFSEDILVRMELAEAEAKGFEIVEVVDLPQEDGTTLQMANVHTTPHECTFL
jgi:phospho-N-acetylmuramoyl-pentapeptide-transferase